MVWAGEKRLEKGIWFWLWTLIFRVEWSKVHMPGCTQKLLRTQKQKSSSPSSLIFTECLLRVHELILSILTVTLRGWYHYCYPHYTRRKVQQCRELKHPVCYSPHVAQPCHGSTEDSRFLPPPWVSAGLPLPSLFLHSLSCIGLAPQAAGCCPGQSWLCSAPPS